MKPVRTYFGRASAYIRDKLGVHDQHSDQEQLNLIWDRMKSQLIRVANQVKHEGPNAFGNILAFLQAPDLLKWTKNLTEGAATIHDKAMDAEYIRTGIGGPEHRLFDGGHTVMGSWQAARNALKDDSTAQEIFGWAEAYVRDLSTTMGVPYFTVDKADFDKWVDALAGRLPGIDRSYLYDLLSLDAVEVCAAGFSVVGLFFAFNKGDKEKLAEILGAMGIASITAANPVLGLITITATAYAYWKHGSVDVAGAVRGGGLTAISVVMFSVMGLPVLVEFAIVVVLTMLLKKHVFDKQDFAISLKEKMQESLSDARGRLGIEHLLSSLPLLEKR